MIIPTQQAYNYLAQFENRYMYYTLMNPMSRNPGTVFLMQIPNISCCALLEL